MKIRVKDLKKMIKEELVLETSSMCSECGMIEADCECSMDEAKLQPIPMHPGWDSWTGKRKEKPKSIATVSTKGKKLTAVGKEKKGKK